MTEPDKESNSLIQEFQKTTMINVLIMNPKEEFHINEINLNTNHPK